MMEIWNHACNQFKSPKPIQVFLNCHDIYKFICAKISTSGKHYLILCGKFSLGLIMDHEIDEDP